MRMSPKTFATALVATYGLDATFMSIMRIAPIKIIEEVMVLSSHEVSDANFDGMTGRQAD